MNETISLTLMHLWETLEPVGAPMALIGGLALGAWERARFTQDVDVLIDGRGIDRSRLLELLKRAGFRPKRDPPVVTIDEIDLIQLWYEPPEKFVDVQVDLLLPQSAFHIAAIRRRTTFTYPGVDKEFAVVACEDLIVLKLLAGRIIDRADAAMLLRRNRERMDLDYLVHWINRLQLDAELNEIWDEAFPGESPPAPA